MASTKIFVLSGGRSRPIETGDTATDEDGYNITGNVVGELYVTTPAATTLNPGTPVKAAGTTTAVVENGVTMSANNRLTNTSGKTLFFECIAHISCTSSTVKWNSLAMFSELKKNRNCWR